MFTSSNDPFLKFPRHKQLCNTRTLHRGFNTKMLWDWQPPKQCGLSRDRNDWNGSWFAGTSEETPDFKDGENFNHRAEIGLSDKTFFLECQGRHMKKGLRNFRLTHLLPTAMASGFLGCHTEFIAQTINCTTTTLLRTGEISLAKKHYSLSTHQEVVAQSNKYHCLISWTN